MTLRSDISHPSSSSISRYAVLSQCSSHLEVIANAFSVVVLHLAEEHLLACALKPLCQLAAQLGTGR